MQANGVDQSIATSMFNTIHDVLTERYEDVYSDEGLHLSNDEQHKLVQGWLSVFARLAHVDNITSIINTYTNPGDMFQYSQSGIEFQLSYLNELVNRGIFVESVEYPRWVPHLPMKQRGGDVDIVIQSLGKRIAVELKSHDWSKQSNITGRSIQDDVNQLRRNLAAIEPDSGSRMFDGVRLLYPRGVPSNVRTKVDEALTQLKNDDRDQSIEYDEY